MNLYVSVCWHLCWVVIMNHVPYRQPRRLQLTTSPKKPKQFSSQFMICDRITWELTKGKRSTSLCRLSYCVCRCHHSRHIETFKTATCQKGDGQRLHVIWQQSDTWMNNHESWAWWCTKHQSLQVEPTKSKLCRVEAFCPFKNFRDGHKHMSAHIGAPSSLSIIPLLIHLVRCPFKGATHLCIMLEHLSWTLPVTSNS